MHTHNLLPPPRLVASGGPVTRAIAACGPEAIEAERQRIRDLRNSIRERILADAALIERLDRAAHALGEFAA